MRQIKFRVFDKAENRMFFVSRMDLFCDKAFPIEVRNYCNDDIEYQWADENVELMQFTGFTDSAGHEIYEGDIVKHRNHVLEIRWDYLGQWVAALDYDHGTQKILPGSLVNEAGRIDSFSIVGNIYEGVKQ